MGARPVIPRNLEGLIGVAPHVASEGLGPVLQRQVGERNRPRNTTRGRGVTFQFTFEGDGEETDYGSVRIQQVINPGAGTWIVNLRATANVVTISGADQYILEVGTIEDGVLDADSLTADQVTSRVLAASAPTYVESETVEVVAFATTAAVAGGIYFTGGLTVICTPA